MKKNLKWLIALMVLTMVFLMTACGDSQKEPAEESAKETAEITVPKEVKDKRSEVESYASDYAAKLTDSSWGDQYIDLIQSGKAREYTDYASMVEVLSDYRKDCGATYIYTLSPDVDGKPALSSEDTNKQPFLITVDGCEDPDEWGTEYEWEIQFTEAWEGAAASARSAWDNDGDGYCWSAFAPVSDSKGNVVCILGIDYPCNELIKAFPEWNRDDEKWCGYEGK